MLGKIESRRRRGATEDEMVGWHHRLKGHEFEQAPGVGEGQGSLACCGPWGRRESDTTERLNNKQSGMAPNNGIISGNKSVGCYGRCGVSLLLEHPWAQSSQHSLSIPLCPFSLDQFSATEPQRPATRPASLLVWGTRRLGCGGVGESRGNK